MKKTITLKECRAHIEKIKRVYSALNKEKFYELFGFPIEKCTVKLMTDAARLLKEMLADGRRQSTMDLAKQALLETGNEDVRKWKSKLN